MAEVITFLDYRPPARYDARPWTQVRIQEAATETGSYLLIDTLGLSPVDPDPALPAARSFTTENATALEYWYRIVFVDATGDTSQPTTPVQNIAGSTGPPVIAYATVAELARVLELRTPTVAQTDAMRRCLDAATQEVDWSVGHATQYTAPYPPLAVEVTLERAVEHWSQSFAPYGVFQASGQPILTARNTFVRHAKKLLPIKETFGVA